MSLELIKTEKAAAAVGPYSQGAKVGNLVFTSGQLHINPETGKLVEGSAADRAKMCLNNIKAILDEAGADVSDVIKVTIFMEDLSEFGEVNEVYAEFFGDHKPARSCVQVAKLPVGGSIEIEAIALIK